MKYQRKRKFKKKNELSFIKTELMRIALRETISMYSELMETEIKTGEKMQNFLRDKVSSVSKGTLKAVSEEYKHCCDYGFEDEELYRKHLKRRNKLFCWIKEKLIDIEGQERQLLRDLYAGRLDKLLLNKYFSIFPTDDKEFGVFNEFFNKYIELKKLDIAQAENVKSVTEVKQEIKEEPAKIDKQKEARSEVKGDAEKEKKVSKRVNKSEKESNNTSDSKDVPPGQTSMFVGIQSRLKTQ